MNRLHPYLDDLISPLQSNFILGHSTSDNALIDQEVMHYIHRTINKHGALAAKVYLEKAYDRVNQDFLQTTFEQFGFLQTTYEHLTPFLYK